MKDKKYSVTQIIRHIIQLAAFIAMPGLFILTFRSIRSVYRALITGTFSLVSQGSALLTLSAVIPVTVLFGRFFCGYLCAFGSMQELTGFIARKLRIKQISVSAKADKILKAFKYIVLVVLIVLWTFDISTDKISPWNVFGTYSSVKGWSDLSAFLTVGGLLLVLIIVSSLFCERFFCRYFCPLGGVFSCLSGARLFKVKKEEHSCVSCGLCSKKCPMNIDVNEETDKHKRVKSAECIDCFRCIDVCPKQCLSTNPKQAVAGTAAAVGIAGLYFAGTMLKPSSSADSPSLSVSEGKYPDGTYQGTGVGYRGEINVTVTVSGGNITGIKVDSSNDDPQFFDRAESAVISEILASQDTDVDAVSGATYSSKGIIEAVENALGINSGITLESTEPSYTQADTQPSTQATAAVTESTTEVPSEESETQTETESTTEETSGVSEPQASQSGGTLQDGTYTGTGKGRNGDVVVTVTVTGGKITSINIESSQEDAPFMERAKSVIDEIINAQSVDVDAVSGATMSSNGILEAVADALGLEFENTNSTIQDHHGGHGKGPGGGFGDMRS